MINPKYNSFSHLHGESYPFYTCIKNNKSKWIVDSILNPSRQSNRIIKEKITKQTIIKLEFIYFNICYQIQLEVHFKSIYPKV